MERQLGSDRDTTGDRRVEPTRSALLGRTRSAIARRLGPVCGDLDASEFDALVERIANVEIKYAQRRADIEVPTPQRSKG